MQRHHDAAFLSLKWDIPSQTNWGKSSGLTVNQCCRCQISSEILKKYMKNHEHVYMSKYTEPCVDRALEGPMSCIHRRAQSSPPHSSPPEFGALSRSRLVLAAPTTQTQVVGQSIERSICASGGQRRKNGHPRTQETWRMQKLFGGDWGPLTQIQQVEQGQTVLLSKQNESQTI